MAIFMFINFLHDTVTEYIRNESLQFFQHIAKGIKLKRVRCKT